MLRCQICIHGFFEDAKEGDEGGVNDIQGKGRRGDLFDNSSEHSRAKRSPFWSDALSSYTARTVAMYIHTLSKTVTWFLF